MRPSIVLTLVVTLLAPVAEARPTSRLCADAIAAAESRTRWLPDGLLYAIALTESAHRPDGMRGVVPWPWTINSPKGSFYLDSRREAVAKVEELKGMGVRNIDVGCMQVNLKYHPDAFNSLDDAFHPRSNVGYAVDFLTELERKMPTLFDAVGRYHSGTPWRSRDYAHKVYARWGEGGEVTPPTKHGLGQPDSARLVTRELEERETDQNPGRWRRVYGASASGPTTEYTRDPRSRSSRGWMSREDGTSRRVPSGAGQITFR